MYLKLLILLYADDTVSFSDNKDDLQLTFNVFSECCLQLRSTVNISKTKIVVFSKGRTKHYINFTFQTKNMEIVDTYKYLGIFLGKSGSYVQAKKHIAEQDNKALFGLLQKIINDSLPLDVQMNLFNKTVKPVLLYGCDLWGVGNIEVIGSVQLEFYKQILNLKKATPSYMIYGKLDVICPPPPPTPHPTPINRYKNAHIVTLGETT